MRTRRSRRPLALSALLCLLPLAGAYLTGCQSDVPNPFGPSEEAQDDAARLEYFQNAAITYYDGGRYDLAERQFRKVVAQDPDDKKAKRGLAKSLYMQAASGRLSRRQRLIKLLQAQELLEEIVDLEWPNPDGQGSRRYEVQTDLANVYADQADLFDRDIRDLQRMMKTDPNADERALMAKSRVQVQKRNDLLQKAIPLYDTVLQVSADNPYALTGLAKAHLQMGNDETGIHYATKYLELSQRSQYAWKKELEKYAESVGGMDKVTRDQRKVFIDKIQGAREKEKRMHLMLASVHMRRLEFGQAVEQYSDVIKIDDAMPAAYLERAQALAALQRYQRAIDDIEEYLKITDPQRHRTSRVRAVQLLDRYQSALARRPDPAAASRRPAAPRRPAQPAGNPYGSPDG